ncbi:MAG: ABC transporter ATP-binding protein [Nocardioides sp.]
MTPSVVQAAALCRSYQLGTETVRALDSVSLDVEAGEFVSIVGPSGSGKSTLLHILGLMDSPDSGNFHLLGHQIDQLSVSQRSRLRAEALGFVFQAFHLIDHRQVVDNVAMPLTYRRVPRARRRAQAAAALDRVSLTHRRHAYPTTLSGGERQRVAIARAMIGQPRLLLCDEPTGNLDSVNSERIIELLRDAANQGIAVIVVTHDHAIAGQTDRVLTMVDGRLTATATATADGGTTS